MLPNQSDHQPSSPIAGLTEGRLVNYVLDNGPNAGQIRPALIVRVWNNQDLDSQGLESQDLALGCCNLVVFIDRTNDYPGIQSNTIWNTSRYYSENKEPGTWHYPEISPSPYILDFESPAQKVIPSLSPYPNTYESLLLSKAEIAYTAYKQSTGGVNYQGLPMPEWKDLRGTIKGHWIFAVRAFVLG